MFVAGLHSFLQQFVAPISIRLRELGMETVAVASGSHENSGAFTRSYRLPMHRRQSVWRVSHAQLALLRIVRQERPALLHLHTPYGLLLGRIAAQISGSKSLAVVHASFFDEASLSGRLYSNFERYAARWSFANVVLNYADLDDYLSSACSAVLAPVGGVGLDERRLADALASPIQIAGSPALLVVGRLSHEKGILNVVDAVAGLRVSQPDAHLTLLGSPHPGDARLTIPTLRWITHIDWVGDAYPFIAGADVLISGSRRETFGMTVAEAIALGTRVVTVDNRGAATIAQLLPTAPVWRCGPSPSDLCQALLVASIAPDPPRPGTVPADWMQSAAIEFHVRQIESAIRAGE